MTTFKIEVTDTYDAPNRALRAVQADFDRMCAYFRGDWCYVVVTVESDDGTYSESIGGVESDYTEETIAELTAEIERQISNDTRKAKINNRFADAMECGL